MATSTSLCMAVRMASGMVRVTPCRFPANMMVAPNSPMARPQHRIAPDSNAGQLSGSVIRQKVRKLLTPSVSDACS